MTTTQIMPGIRQIKNLPKLQPKERGLLGPMVSTDTTEQSAQIAALELIGWIDDNLDFDRVHFWQRDRLLITLDEVVNALLARELEIVWAFYLSGSFEEVEARTRELRYQFPIAEEREEAEGETWRRLLRTGRVRY